MLAIDAKYSVIYISFDLSSSRDLLYVIVYCLFVSATLSFLCQFYTAETQTSY